LLFGNNANENARLLLFSSFYNFLFQLWIP
jgi:hypothetical protein